MLRIRICTWSVWCLVPLVGCGRDDEPPEPTCHRIVGWVGAPSPHGVVPEEQLNLPEAQRRGMLPLQPDRVSASTQDGKTIECTTSRNGSYYECRSSAGLRAIRVYVGEQSFSKTTEGLACDDYWAWENTIGPYLDFWLSALRPCVSQQTSVVTGQLLVGDASVLPSVSITLEGEPMGFDVFTSQLSFDRSRDEVTPRVACEVLGGSYRCRALGYRMTMPHVLVTKVGDHETRTALTLPVEDCRPELVTQDVAPCPTEPQPLRVQALAYQAVSASYEGGAPVPCMLEDGWYVCSPGTGSAHGEGRYDVLAEKDGVAYAASVTRSFDGCLVEPATVPLRRQSALPPAP